jgi:uncharacterized membrane protein (UPF0127 family)
MPAPATCRLALEGTGATLHVRLASSWGGRALGWLRAPPPGPSDGLWLRPCAAVHTVGMAWPIDVVFLDRGGVVRKIVPDLRPWRIALARGAHSVLECRAGTAARLGLRPGQRFTVLQAGQGR